MKRSLLRVKAIRRGFYDLQLKEEGAKFRLAKIEDFSHEWMKPLDFKPPPKKLPPPGVVVEKTPIQLLEEGAKLDPVVKPPKSKFADDPHDLYDDLDEDGDDPETEGDEANPPGEPATAGETSAKTPKTGSRSRRKHQGETVVDPASGPGLQEPPAAAGNDPQLDVI